jgi:hypothetical protein
MEESRPIAVIEREIQQLCMTNVSSKTVPIGVKIKTYKNGMKLVEEEKDALDKMEKMIETINETNIDPVRLEKVMQLTELLEIGGIDFVQVYDILEKIVAFNKTLPTELQVNDKADEDLLYDEQDEQF